MEFDAHDVQVLSLFAVVVQYVFTGQSVHDTDPLVVLNFPATQAVHAPPSGPVYPGAHTHCDNNPLPAPETVFAGHVWHTSIVAPTAVEYLPARQSEHTAEPFATLNLPATHALHATRPPAPVYPASHMHAALALLPAGEMLLVRQDVHTALVVAAVAVEYVLTAHNVHACDPAEVLYVPDKHAEQTPPLAPVYPRSHRHCVETLLPVCSVTDGKVDIDKHVVHALSVFATAVENVLTGQSTHGKLPVTVLYVPAGQATPAIPLAPLNPAFARQLISKPWPVASVYVFEGQVVHVLSVFAVVFEYVPRGQTSQACGPVKTLYCPTGQATHTLPLSVNPALQIHWLSSVLPAGDTMFEGQSVQLALLVSVLYLFATHIVQVPPFGPVYPGMHAQSVSSSLCGSELLFDGQKLHAVCPTALA
jgi:hypothetical protein